MAGLAINPVQVYSTLPGFDWEFLRLWTGFALPCYGLYIIYRNRNILDFMKWPHIGLGPRDLNDTQRPKSFQKNS
jgi:hypothetical protein